MADSGCIVRADRPPSFTKAQRLQVAIDHGAIVLCQVCWFAIYVAEMEIDHHLAWIDGGEHERMNWRPLCFGCHRKKSAKEHSANAKCKRIAKKNSGLDQKPKRKIPGGRPLRGRVSWPESRPLPSRPFPKRQEQRT